MIRRTLMAGLLGAVVSTAAGSMQGPHAVTVAGSGIDGGGCTSSGGAFVLAGTIGQPDASVVPPTGGGYTLVGGFQAGAGSAVDPPCPEDIDGDGVIAVPDLPAVLAAWGGCPACPADTSGDGAVDLVDLLAVLSAWGLCP